MTNRVLSKAEEQFAATQKKDKIILEEKELIKQERSAKTARLKALRLAKEASENVEV